MSSDSVIYKALIADVVQVISTYLGSSTAEQYRRFYQSKPLPIILDSLEELLIEIIGQPKAKQEMLKLNIKHKIKDDKGD